MKIKDLILCPKSSEYELKLINAHQIHADALDVNIDEITIDIEECQHLNAYQYLWIARKGWYGDQNALLPSALMLGQIKAVIISNASMIDQIMGLDIKIPIFYCEIEDPLLADMSCHFYQNPTLELKVFGVTGTNGKTSTTHFLRRALEALGERVALIGTVHYSFEDRILTATNTTPDALVIQRFAKEALDLGATALVLEVSSHALSLGRVQRVAFDAVGFCNLGRDHLDFHQSMAEYRFSKGLLADRCVQYSLSQGKKPLVVAHCDEEGLRFMARKPLGVQGLLIQLKDQVDQIPSALSEIPVIRIIPSLPTLLGFHLSFMADQESIDLHFPLIGDYHQENLALAFVMLFEQAKTYPSYRQFLEKVGKAFENDLGVKGRMEQVICFKNTEGLKIALVDYAHTADALEKALKTLRQLHQDQQFVVFGCGGNRDKGKRPLMLKVALENADHVFLTADNPRFETITEIINDSLAYLDQLDEETQRRLRSKITIEEDRVKAIDLAWRQLKTGALLVAGKGHEDYQEINGVRYEMSDQALIHGSQKAIELQQELHFQLIEKHQTNQRLPRLTKIQGE